MTNMRDLINIVEGVEPKSAVLPYLVTDHGNLTGRYSTLEKALKSVQRVFRQADDWAKHTGKTPQWGRPEDVLIRKDVKWNVDDKYPDTSIVAKFDAQRKPIITQE